jgi:putative membrane protein
MTEPRRSGRRPTAFRLDEATLVEPGAQPPADVTAVVLADGEDEAAAAPPRRRRSFSWGSLFLAGLGAIVSLGIGVAVDQLIRDLFARAEWLGWLAAAIAAVTALAALVVVLREAIALLRLRRIDKLRSAAEAAAAADDRAKAEAAIADLVRLVRDRPETARGRAAMADHLGEIIDGRDLLVLAEREILAPLDRRATAMVVAAAKRVSVVTALSPRALVDMLYVLAEAVSLVRRLATLYGGRPGALGFVSLMREVVSHLAVTGGLAAGDSLIHEIVGRSVASRLSARLGEGVVNGLMTARVGLAAIDVCRPLPFLATKRPTVSDVVGEVARIVPADDRKAT